ncbi:hypothetical protein BURMUCF1_2300 [Burkholderia multivorans ATCC BAA-247]|nr:hypothetical protein BURMUCF1_2300 [Burkholderia multivorans ATCC BAA-247]
MSGSIPAGPHRARGVDRGARRGGAAIMLGHFRRRPDGQDPGRARAARRAAAQEGSPWKPRTHFANR